MLPRFEGSEGAARSKVRESGCSLPERDVEEGATVPMLGASQDSSSLESSKDARSDSLQVNVACALRISALISSIQRVRSSSLDACMV